MRRFILAAPIVILILAGKTNAVCSEESNGQITLTLSGFGDSERTPHIRKDISAPVVIRDGSTLNL